MVVSIVIVVMGVLATVCGQPADMGQLPALPETNLKVLKLPDPPKLVGPLTPNHVLSKAFKFAKGVVSGPESLASDGSYIFTGVKNSQVYEFGLNRNGAVTSWRSWQLIKNTSCTAQSSTQRDEEICGRPLGIRAVRNGIFTDLIVLDAARGIYRIRFTTDRRRPRGMFDRLARYRRGVVEQIMDARNINQQRIQVRFLNDLAIAKSGFIFFTSSSDKFSRSQFMNIILEGDKSGRVLVYNPHAKATERVSVLAKNLHFPNGLQLSPDETFLLVAEGARARIHKIWLATEKRGQIEIFADNLPGFIDNLRPTTRGTYWVGLSSIRYHGKPGVLDMYGPQPKVRQLIVSLPKEQVMARSPKYGMVVELNADGQIIRSLHDPDGTVYGPVSEVMEYEGFLLLGSYKAPFIGTIQLSQLPPAVDPPPTQPDPQPQTPAPPTTTPRPTLPPPTSNPQVNFLNRARAMISNMPQGRLREVIMILLSRYLEARLDVATNMNRANRIQMQLNEISQAVPPAPGSPGRTITTQFSGDSSTAGP